MRRIEICSNKGLLLRRETFAPEAPAAVLCSSGTLRAARYEWLDHKLMLAFDDITDERRPTAFRREQADRIAAFVRDLPENQTLVFCCDSGESRSAALAAAFLRAGGGDEMTIWTNPHYHPNPTVYRIQCRALGISVTEEELRARRAESELALQEAVRRSRG